jgi:hypothetical protein
MKGLTLVVTLAIALELFGVCAKAQNQLDGEWSLEPTSTAVVVHLTLRCGYSGKTGFNIGVGRLVGLTPNNLTSGSSAVKFWIIRDAGVLAFDGWIKEGRGSGRFTLTAQTGFVSELKKRGYDEPTFGQLALMTLYDVGLPLIDELQAQGYERPSLNQLVKMGDEGVGLEYVRDLGTLGYRVQNVDTLIRMQVDEITPSFIRGLAEVGYQRLPLDELIKASDHGVNGTYVEAMAELGYGGLTIQQYIKARDHEVTPSYVKRVRALGYEGLSLEELIRMRDREQ